MKYVSIDIETTGLDEFNCQTLSVAAIIEDTATKLPFSEIPKFHVAIRHKEIKGSTFAINMNAELIGYINDYNEAKTQFQKDQLVNETGMQFVYEQEVAPMLYNFLLANGLGENGKPITINAAGKNFGTFDRRFLNELPEMMNHVQFRSRVIDPAILFVDWNTDESLPSLNDCKRRAKIEGLVTHNALEDAWDVINVLRTNY